MTNGDKIRNMNDVELAGTLVVEGFSCAGLVIRHIDEESLPVFIDEVNKNMGELIQEKLSWLQKEATSDDEQ